MEFEFTTTACARPELLDQTYSWLSKALVDVDTKKEGKLYINIDPFPTSCDKVINETIGVANTYFSDVKYRVGEPGGNFPAAVSWVLNQPKQKYFFNIEDDWKILGEVRVSECVDEILKLEKTSDNVLQCVLRDRNKGVTQRIYFPPSVYKTETIQQILKKHPIPHDANPEKWIWNLKARDRLIDYNVTSKQVDRVVDIGNPWKRRHKVIKDDNNLQGHKNHFFKYKIKNSE